MKEEFNVLFSSSGRRVSLMRAFVKSIEKLGLKGNIIAADLSMSAPTMHITDRKYLVPRVSDPEYVPRLIEICEKEKAKLLVPLIDPELPLLARSRDKFAEIATTLNISAPETTDIAADKQNTFNFFKSINLNTPWLYEYTEGDPSILENVSYPCIIKPARGSAGIGINLAHDEDELLFYSSRTEEPLLQQYIDGREYTTDVVVDKNHKCLCAIPRMRIEIRGGEVSKGVTVRHPLVIEGITKIAESLPGSFGVMNIQCFEDESRNLYFSEINARFGGGFPLAYRAGADLPKWLIQIVLDKRITDDTLAWKEGLVMLRYDDEIWTERGKINT